MEHVKIIIEYWAKPIPMRQFDWEAMREGYDEGDLIGTGATEEESIADLIQQEEEIHL